MAANRFLRSLRSSALLALAIGVALAGQKPPAAKRLVILKVDGLPAGLAERYVRERDPVTGKSRLPWIDLVFHQQGAIISNFYVRGISLSVPSWSLLDTGQHLVIRGNVEYDRYTNRVYDYMNFFPFYVNYARLKQVDMPGVEVLDEAGVKLLIDRYPVEQRYQSLQLYQRGVDWQTLKGSLLHRITSRSPRQLINEWQSGFVLSSGVNEQIERELEAKLADPKVLYLDLYTGDYDHIAHLSNDAVTQYDELKHLDALVGRIWTAIQGSSQAANTVLVLVSDHGMNTDPAVYSQGYSLVDFFNSVAGGGHHVITNRHPLDEYKLQGLDPFVSEVTTASPNSIYLQGQAEQYPTVLLDLDGNERASIHFRNGRFNELHILLQRLSRKDLPREQRAIAVRRFFTILDEQRPTWERELSEIKEELRALKRKIDRQSLLVEEQQRKWTQSERDAGLDRDARREGARLHYWEEDYAGYTEYTRILARLLSTEPSQLDPLRVKIEDLIPRRAMGDPNTIYDLQNYAIGPDSGTDFRRMDYFPVLTSLRVRNSVQPGVGIKPIDFLAMRASDAAIWLYESADSQALILSRGDQLRYVPVKSLTQDRSGQLHYTEQAIRAGLPLRYFEDPNLNVAGDRAAWLTAWHTEREWLDAVHRTEYSDGIIGLREQLSPIVLPPQTEPATQDDILLRRFEQRRRDNVQADLLVLANNHWNFNARNFNPGGNHGSFYRISTHATLLFAGAGVPHGLEIERPYDSLSFFPTVLSLAGALESGELDRLPGQPITELVPAYNGSR